MKATISIFVAGLRGRGRPCRVMLLLLLFYCITFSSDQVNHWTNSPFRGAAFLWTEQQEALGHLPVTAGSWTVHGFNLDTVPTRTTLAYKGNVLRWIPSAFAGVSITDGASAALPLEIGNRLEYHYGSILSAAVDGIVYRRIPAGEYETYEQAHFLGARGAEPERNLYTYNHISGLDFFDFAQNTAYLRLRTRFLDFSIGRRRIRWGHGFNGGLLISGNAPPLNLLYMIEKKIGDYLYLSSFFGSPDHNSDIFPDNLPDTLRYAKGERYVAAHRLELALFDRVRIAVSELANLNGQREFNRYINPLQMHYLTSSRSELASNMLASVELWVRLFPGITLYGELMADDPTMFEKGNPTRFGYQLGTALFDVGKKWPVDIRTEYTYARAYTYTHFLDSKNWHIWSGQCAGYWTGPDSDHLYFHVDKDFPTAPLSVRLTLQTLRRGERDLFTAWDRELHGSGEGVPYIQGVPEKKLALDLSSSFSPRNFITCFGSIGWMVTQNHDHEHGNIDQRPTAQLLMEFCF